MPLDTYDYACSHRSLQDACNPLLILVELLLVAGGSCATLACQMSQMRLGGKGNLPR